MIVNCPFSIVNHTFGKACMDLGELMNSNLPAIGCAVLAALFLLELYKFVKKTDIPSWMRRLNNDVARAANDKDFLAAQLKKTETELAAKPTPNPIREITFVQEHRLRGLPRLILILSLVGVASCYIGLFWNGQDARWPVYLGWVLLTFAAMLYLRVSPLLERYSRAQLLNRKYLLQKVAGDTDQKETLRELMRYYPETVGLRMEMADRLASEGKIAEALEELAKAAANEPENVDVTMMRVSMLLRKNQAGEAEKLLAEAEKLPRQPLDPRDELYRAALAEKRGEKEKTGEYLAKARERNAGVCEIMLKNDAALAGLRTFSKG